MQHNGEWNTMMPFRKLNNRIQRYWLIPALSSSKKPREERESPFNAENNLEMRATETHAIND